MGNLPQFRLIQLKPFSKVGVDFSGPFEAKADIKIKITKTYICIFVCLVTTVVHIELVSNLSTLFSSLERPKWNRPDKNLQLDDLVIIKEPTPPLKWSTSRVIEVHSEDDGIVD
ncbi:unnamed protein product [Macrosiphum euphorbiae]|uniref:DUF5641 domain-containing protein n=1 Tax=Macrosiphum euphorbiae TaxID=13131 RepID=A0AAV0XVW9_9HEMI|nr:unnamed protein product [Macrosiphum euphorbiae]